jgi:hypothetical protein
MRENLTVRHLHPTSHVIARTRKQVGRKVAPLNLSNGIFMASEFLDTNAGRSRSLEHPTVPYLDKPIDGAGCNDIGTPFIPIEA